MTTPDSQRVVPVELLPCPFCGGQAECVQRGSFMEDIPYVCCRQCRCFQDAEELDVAIAAWNRRAPAASPPVAPLAAAQERVKPIPACWRYVHADPSNSSGWMDYDGDAELWELRGKKAQANGLTIELAYSRPPAQTQPASPADRMDGERLDWLMRQVRGDEFRRIGIDTSAGCTRAAIDAAREG